MNKIKIIVSHNHLGDMSILIPSCNFSKNKNNHGRIPISYLGNLDGRICVVRENYNRVTGKGRKFGERMLFRFGNIL